MNDTFYKGNFDDISATVPDHNGWIFGQFMDKDTLLHDQDLELKWNRLPAGTDFPSPHGVRTGKSMTILIEGKIEVSFPESDTTVTLEKQGDFVTWLPKTMHTSRILEDATLLTMRWPSIESDTIRPGDLE